MPQRPRCTGCGPAASLAAPVVAPLSVALVVALVSEPLAIARVEVPPPSSTSGGPRTYDGPQSVPQGPSRGVDPWLPGEPDAAVERVPDPEGPRALPQAEPDGDAYDVARDSPEGVQATRRIRGGIILAVGGVLLVAGAAALSSTDPCLRQAGNGCQKAARTRGALSMGIPGGVMIVGAAALLGIGIAARRRLRAGVEVGRTGGVFVLQGRF